MATTIATRAMMMLLKPHAACHLFFSPQAHHSSQTIAQHHHNCQQRQHQRLRVTCCSLIHNSHSLEAYCQKLVDEFDPDIPIEKAVTPPSSWYINSLFFDMEMSHVFHRGWQVVGNAEQIKDPHDFFTGRLGNMEFVVCRDDNGKLHAFHNVCRHHASLLASGSGQMSCFVCPYHAWTYGLDGALLKATRITGMQNFDVKDFGLIPINVAAWGPFILLNFDKEISPQEACIQH
uniref:Choline monooxygenaseic-like n=1 Tax=Rhizophora mucronata TaxID=61149 RepID=A0A2P2JX03_RHIMU